MNTKNITMKIQITSFIALSAMLAFANCYGGDEKKSESKTIVTKEVSVSVNPIDKDGNPLTPEETKKMLEALGGDEKLLDSVKEALKEAVTKSKNGGKSSSSVSVISSAYIVGPDGKLQEIDPKKDGIDVKISDDAQLNSIVKSISMTLAGGKNGSTIDIQSLNDLNISGLIASAVGGNDGSGFSNKEIQAELTSLKKELAAQRELLNKIYKKLEEK